MKKKYCRILSGGLTLLAVLCAAFFWLTAGFVENSDSGALLTGSWYYRDAQGVQKAVTLPCTLRRQAPVLELLYEPTVADAERFGPGNVIAVQAAVYEAELYWNGQLLYRFEDGGREINAPVRGNMVCAGTIPAVQAENSLLLICRSNSGTYELPAVSVSTEKALVLRLLKKYGWGLLMSLAMVLVGVISLLAGLVLVQQRQNGGRIVCIGLFLVFCGLWCASDSPFVFYLLDYCGWVFALDFYFFMVMPIPLFGFVLRSGSMGENRVLAAAGRLYYFNVIGQSVLAAAGVFTFFRMLIVSHALMVFVGVLTPLYALARAYRMKKDSEVLLCLRAITTVGLIGAFAITLYLFFDYAAYQLVFQTGLLLLMCVLVSALLREFVEAVKSRAEAVVYKQLSEQDKLTKLENRRAFDALLERMESGALKYQNAALLFMDVNFLKQTNDIHGHAAGDQLLLEAAACVKNAFDPAGYCYRIGGDEFCAILLDPTDTADELLGRMTAEQERINRRDDMNYPLSLACGCCFVVEDGIRRTLQQWEATADKRMYENKKRIKEKMHIKAGDL